MHLSHHTASSVGPIFSISSPPSILVLLDSRPLRPHGRVESIIYVPGVRVPALHTDRLLIRELTPADDDAVRAVGVDPAPGWLAWTAQTYGQFEALMQPPYGERAITLRDSGEVLGLIGLVPSYGPFEQIPGLGGSAQPARFRPEMGLYWTLAPERRGNGYATEAARVLIDHAFAALNLARIVATTERSNTASQAVMRRLGMRVEENPLPEPEWFQVVGWLETDQPPAS